MTHMQQMIAMGIWQAFAPVAVAAVCLVLYYWWMNRPNDDDDNDQGDAPGLTVAPAGMGFHTPRGKTA